MPLSHEARYPSRRTDVLRLRSDAKPDVLAGGLENMVSGRQQEFASGHELIDSITCDFEVSDAGARSSPRANES